MAEKFQSLLDKIQEKGVKEAEATAAGIIADAEKEAKAIRRKPEPRPKRPEKRPPNRPNPSKNERKRRSARLHATSSLNCSRNSSAA